MGVMEREKVEMRRQGDLIELDGGQSGSRKATEGRKHRARKALYSACHNFLFSSSSQMYYTVPWKWRSDDREHGERWVVRGESRRKRREVEWKNIGIGEASSDISAQWSHLVVLVVSITRGCMGQGKARPSRRDVITVASAWDCGGSSFI
jgi:hypothetical protein